MEKVPTFGSRRPKQEELENRATEEVALQPAMGFGCTNGIADPQSRCVARRARRTGPKLDPIEFG